MLIYNAKIFTSDKNNLFVDSLIVKNNIITWTGSNNDAKDIINKHKNDFNLIINANNKSILPGFNDSHFHLSLPSYFKEDLDLSNITSYELFLKIFEEYKLCYDSGWLIGYNCKMDLFNIILTRDVLDKISNKQPIVIFDYNKTKIYCNTVALRLSRLYTKNILICENSIIRDNEGYSNGILTKGSFQILQAHIPKIGVMNDMVKHGITSAHIMGSSIREFNTLKSIEKKGGIPVRIMVAIDRESFRTCKDLQSEINKNSNLVRIGALKLYMDGLVDCNTAFRLETPPCNKDIIVPWGKEKLTYRAHCPAPPSSEKTYYSIKSLVKHIKRAEEYGLQVCIHATGDAAVRRVLDAYAIVSDNKYSHSRHRIEHVELCEDSDFKRFGELGILASMSPLHAPNPDFIDDDSWIEKVHPIIYDRAFAWNSIRKYNGRIPFSTDFPVVDLNPLLSLDAAISRYPLLPDDPIHKYTLEEAILGYTSESTYAEFQDHHKGQIKPGMLADFVILSNDIFNIQDSKRIQNITVDMTICNGNITYITSTYNWCIN